MNIVQLCDHIDEAVAEASVQLGEDRHPQAVLQALTQTLADLTESARRSPRHTSMVAISGDGGTTIQVGGHFYGR